MAIIDVVKFDGLRSRDWLVYKFPSDTLVFGTRLIVNEGQVAVFVKGGQVCDLFYPGSYILDTDNLPVLFHIFNLPYGGEYSLYGGGLFHQYQDQAGYTLGDIGSDPADRS